MATFHGSCPWCPWCSWCPWRSQHANVVSGLGHRRRRARSEDQSRRWHRWPRIGVDWPWQLQRDRNRSGCSSQSRRQLKQHPKCQQQQCGPTSSECFWSAGKKELFPTLLHRSAESVFHVFGKELRGLHCAMGLLVSLAMLCVNTAKKRMMIILINNFVEQFYKIQYLNISEAGSKKLIAAD